MSGILDLYTEASLDAKYLNLPLVTLPHVAVVEPQSLVSYARSISGYGEIAVHLLAI